MRFNNAMGSALVVLYCASRTLAIGAARSGPWSDSPLDIIKPASSSYFWEADTASESPLIPTGTGALPVAIYSIGRHQLLAQNGVGPRQASRSDTGSANFLSLEVRDLDSVRLCSRFPGITAGAKIQACIDDLPERGGIADARGLAGAQTINLPIRISKPIRLLLGAATFHVNGDAQAFNIVSTGVAIQGLGSGITDISLVNGIDGIVAGANDVTIVGISISDLRITGGRHSLSLNNVVGGNFARVWLSSARIGIYMMGQNENQMWSDIHISDMTGNAILTGEANGSNDFSSTNYPEIQKVTFDLLRLAGTSGATAARITAGAAGSAQQASGDLTFRRVMCEGNKRGCMHFSFTFNSLIDILSTEDSLDANNEYSALLIDNNSVISARNVILGNSVASANNYKYYVEVQSGMLSLFDSILGAGEAAETADIRLENNATLSNVMLTGGASTGLSFSNKAAKARTILFGVRNSSGAFIDFPNNYPYLSSIDDRDSGSSAIRVNSIYADGYFKSGESGGQNSPIFIIHDDANQASWISYGSDALTRFKSTSSWNFETVPVGTDRLGIGTPRFSISSVDGAFRAAGSTVTNLGTPADGTITYVTDGLYGSNPCTGGSSGAIAKRIAGVWRCD